MNRNPHFTPSMTHRFQKHYTREEAAALLPQIRLWLQRLQELRRALEKYDKRLGGMLAEGQDLGGEQVNKWIRTIGGLKTVLDEFQTREILIKDVERGLIDFPALFGDKEVFLCWEQSEPEVEYWHDLDSGYAGREPL